MSKVLDITRLSRDEKLDLLDRLWENLGRDPGAFPLTDLQREELDRRLDELDSEGPSGLSWDEVVAQARAHANKRQRSRACCPASEQESTKLF